MYTSGEKIVVVPLETISRETARKVKTSSVQVKIIQKSGNEPLHLLAACEEGMFEARFTASKLRKSKVKQDLGDDTWESILRFLLDTSLTQKIVGPPEFENTLLLGRLTSSEVYDPHSGSLVGDELSDFPSEFELSVRTKGELSIEYGTLTLRYVNTEELPKEDHEKLNLLKWIEDSSKQTSYVQEVLFETVKQLRKTETLLAEKKQIIEELESDYKLIVHDLEDRFLQVLQSKKRMIASLQGDIPEDFTMLNDTYRKRQRSNLKILNLEDIIVTDGDRKHGERRERRMHKESVERKPIVKNRKVKVKGEIKEEKSFLASNSAIKNENHNFVPEEKEFKLQKSYDKNKNGPKVSVSPLFSTDNSVKPELALNLDSDLGSENALDFTDRGIDFGQRDHPSVKDYDVSHVHEILRGTGNKHARSDSRSNDKDNETEYSE